MKETSLPEQKRHINSFEYLSQDFVKRISEVRIESFNYFSKQNELNQKVQCIYRFKDTLIELPSCNSSPRIPNCSPLLQAANRLQESINLAICGLYKAAYDCLRSYLELLFLDIHYSVFPDSEKSMDRWIDGKKGTPSFQKC